VSYKGAVSVYGMGRFPVTLIYYEQWLRLLGAAEELRARFWKRTRAISSCRKRLEFFLLALV
jgi:hypothetical protein